MNRVELIKIADLSFSYDTMPILNNVHLQMNAGDISCIIGDNGTGKTTLLKLLTGIIHPKNKFKILVDTTTLNVEEFKKKLVFIPSEPQFYDKLSLLENIQIIQYLWKQDNTYIDNVFQFLDELNFDTSNTQLIETYSLGMRYKVALACFFSIDTPLVILDEPLNSLDYDSQNIMINLIKKEAETGRIFLFSSHSTEIQNQLASKIYYLKNQQLHS